MPTPFSVRDIVPYLKRLERGTIEALGDQVDDPSSPNHYSVFGRNGSRDRSRCSADKNETWNPCGYNSMRAIYRGAMRVGSEKVKNFCARCVKKVTEVWAPWIRRWGQPPGEDSRYPPCGSMEEGKGDTDPDRHENIDSLCLILADPEMRERGGITKANVMEFADAHFLWLLKKGPGYLRKPREYLRYGYVADSWLGLSRVYEAVGEPTRSLNALEAATWMFWFMFKDAWKTTEIGTDGTAWPLWNYGDLEPSEVFGTQVFTEPFEGVVETRHGPEFDDRWGDPFNYGWRRFGSESWYDGYLFDFLRRFWFRMVEKFGPHDAAAARAAMVFDVMFQWYHPTRRVNAPLGDFAGPGARDFVNTKLHGWTKTGVLQIDEAPMTVEEWEKLPDDRLYIRLSRTSGHHSSDGLYHEKQFVDPEGVSHDRIHKGRVGIPWESPDEAYIPDFESRGNNYLIADATMTWAMMMRDEEVERYALCQAFDYLHAASSSDAAVKKGKRLEALAPPANQMGYARPWNWAVQCGDFIREIKLGTGG